MTFEGFTLNATVQDTLEVGGGPLVDGRFDSQVSREPPPAAPARAVRPGTSNRTAGKRQPTRVWPPSPRRLDALIEEATVDACGESEQATAFLTMPEERLALPLVRPFLARPWSSRKIDHSDAAELVAAPSLLRNRTALRRPDRDRSSRQYGNDRLAIVTS